MTGKRFSPDTTIEEKDQRIDRRDLLTKAAGVVAGVLAATAVPGIAQAADGDTVPTGTPSDASSTSTGLWGRNLNTYPAGGDGVRGDSVASSKSGVRGVNTTPLGYGVFGSGGWAGVSGESDNGYGLQGSSTYKDGVWGGTTAPEGSGVYGRNVTPSGTGVLGDGGNVGVWGESTTGSEMTLGYGVRGDGGLAGVDGESDTGNGVQGYAHAADRSGLYGVNPDARGYGVYGSGGGTGVNGTSQTGDGVVGTAKVADKSGVVGWNPDAAGYGVFASGGAAGVAGVGTAAGPGLWGRSAKGAGVLADGESDAGLGLVVKGRIRLNSRSGIGTVAKGQSICTVTVPGGLTRRSIFLVTMQGDPGSGVYVRRAYKLSTTQFRVLLNQPAAQAAAFAWLVLD